MNLNKTKIGVVGMGYVGLPIAIAFSQRYPTVGYDISEERVQALRQGQDHTLEVTAEELNQAKQLSMSSDLTDISGCNVYVVTVPTPIDRYKRPDLNPLKTACRELGSVLTSGDCVIFESTVYPGATEEVCGPLLEQHSGLTVNRDFYLAYSPERINPGDKAHSLSSIVKVVSGSTEETADFVAGLYGSIIQAGIHTVSSIKVAEAAKVIENTQRDINIALINELALLFSRLGLDTEEVLQAAGTKWNFLNFRPGLVGGHCIGVDPYYLTHKATEVGYYPEIILAGRRLNDGMADFVVERLLSAMAERNLSLVDARVLVMGLTFKENCPDTRNSQVFRIVARLQDLGAGVDVMDPWVSAAGLEPDQRDGINLVETAAAGTYDAVIVAVAHQQFAATGAEAIRQLGKPHCILFDLKYLFPPEQTDIRL